MTREERLNKVFHYLRSQGRVHTWKDLATAIGTTPPNMSKARHGDPAFLTNALCHRIQNKFREISAQWLITGEGEMIVATNSNNSNNNFPAGQFPAGHFPAGQGSAFSVGQGSALTSSAQGPAFPAGQGTALTPQPSLADYSSMVNATIAAKDETIASLMRELEAKDMLIRSLQNQVSDLRYSLTALKEKGTVGYPFPMGVAEDGNHVSTRKMPETSAKYPSKRK